MVALARIAGCRGFKGDCNKLVPNFVLINLVRERERRESTKREFALESKN